MSQHDYVLDNQSGSNFRSDLNAVLAAIVSQNSGNAEPTTMYAYMPWIDTSGANPILKIRNAANSAWITIGRVDIANYGLLPLAGGTLTGALSSTNTNHWKIPVGTTAQRDGSPVAGMYRFNTDLVQFEGYNGTAWAPIGGGGFIITAVANISGGGTIAISTTDQRQMRHIQGNAAPVTTSNTPFGTTAPRDGTEIALIGNDDANSVTIPYNDAAKGCVGNFTNLEITRYDIVKFVYSASLDRYILMSQGV